MRNRNTRGMIEYLLESVYWHLIALWCYRHTLFAVVPDLGYDRSVLVLNALVALGVSSGFLLTFRNRRNGMSIFVSIACAFGTYFMLSFWQTDRMDFTRVLGYSLGVAVFYGTLVVTNYVRDRVGKRTEASVRKCAYGCFMGVRTILAMGMAVILLGAWTGLTTVGAKEDVVFSGERLYGTEQTIAENMDAVLLLQDAEWEMLNLSERLAVMQTVADIETWHLGVGNLKVCAKPMDESTLGYYTDSTRTVNLSLDLLAGPDVTTVLKTLCHEVYHSYEFRLVEVFDALDAEQRELLLFQDAGQFRNEFANYIDGENDYEGYSQQRCELASDQYAEYASTNYYYAIYRYSVENGLIGETEG